MKPIDLSSDPSEWIGVTPSKDIEGSTSMERLLNAFLGPDPTDREVDEAAAGLKRMLNDLEPDSQKDLVDYWDLTAALGRALDSSTPEFWEVVSELEKTIPGMGWANAMTDGGR